MHHNFCIHSSDAGHLGCLQFLAITNKFAMNRVESVTVWAGGVPFGYMLKHDKTGQIVLELELFVVS